jgi:PilZ domain
MAVRTVDIPNMDFRRHRRFVCACTVYIGGVKSERMTASDLSASGVRLQTVKALGEQILVDIEFEGYPQIVQGAVRHEIQSENGGWYLGVEFLETQPNLLDIILGAHDHNG